MKFGRHMPTNSNPLQALEIAKTLGCETIQIFVNNPMAWRQPQEPPLQPGKPDRVAAFAQTAAEHGIEPIVVHAPYLINLASPDDDLFHKSGILLAETIKRARRYGAQYVVFHIGSHRGSGVAAGIRRIAEGLRGILPTLPDGITILVENDVGAGDELGNRLEHLADLLNLLPDHQERLGVCLDTAHLWGAGYDLGNVEEGAKLLADFERLIGVRRLPVIHLNDTKTACGGHRDLHARIGEGIIPQSGLRALLTHPLVQHTAILLETPIQSLESDKNRLDWARDKQHLARARSLAVAEQPLSQPTATAPHP